MPAYMLYIHCPWRFMRKVASIPADVICSDGNVVDNVGHETF